MKFSKKIICTVMAVLMAASTVAFSGISASAASVKAPKTVKAANIRNGIKVKWSKVKGATKYILYRGSKKIATTKKRTYTDSDIHTGTTCKYKVKAVKGNAVSKAKASKKVVRFSNSTISTISNTASGVKLTWAGKSKANKYLVYRKTTGDYSKIATVTSKSYKDKSAVSGTKYTYKVVAKNTKTGAKSTASDKSITYLASVSGITARQNLSMDGITVNWTAVKGATSYAVYRQKCTESSFKKVGTATTTTYNDKSAATDNPTAYTYKVVAVKGNYTSNADTMRFAAYVPKGNNDNRYYYDAKHNAHIKLYFKTGDVYAEGKALADYLSLGGMYQEKITQGEDVITLSNSVITAKKAGTAVVEITLSDAAMNIVNGLNNAGTTALSNNVVYLEITVK